MLAASNVGIPVSTTHCKVSICSVDKMQFKFSFLELVSSNLYGRWVGGSVVARTYHDPEVASTHLAMSVSLSKTELPSSHQPDPKLQTRTFVHVSTSIFYLSGRRCGRSRLGSFSKGRRLENI